LEKAEKALERAYKACSSKDSSMFEDTIILFANYSRAAADASIVALMIWLLDYVESTLDSLGFSRIFHACPEIEKLNILLADTSFKELHKIAILFGLSEAEKRIKELEDKYGKLKENLCWRLRNALSHGWPYWISIESCSISIPGGSVTLDHMKEFLKLLKEYLGKVAALIGKS